MWSMRKAQQQVLFEQENALKVAFTKEFFAQIPQTPGVYTFFGSQGHILYIGKAKNLKKRLVSYRRLKVGCASRKVLRMLRLIREIRWEELASEKAALLRENELLRTLQPPFNIVNTRPESYYIVSFQVLGEKRFSINLRTAGAPQPEGVASESFGVFKGRGRVREAFQSLLRLLWIAFSEPTENEMVIPFRLMRTQAIYDYTLETTQPDLDLQPWLRMIRSYFLGTNRKLLRTLTESFLQSQGIPPYFNSLIQNDLLVLDEFFTLSSRKNYHLRRFHRLGNTMIPHDEIDDLIVMFNFREP